MRRLVCRLIGHRWRMPYPPMHTVDQWVKGKPSHTDLLWRDCQRCGRGEHMDWVGYWRPRS